jgi:hypothetical protein
MAASTGMKSLKHFCKAINAVYADEALRNPNAADINRLLDEKWPPDFLDASAVLTACTGNGKTVPVLGRGCSRREKKNFQLLFLKQLPITELISGITILAPRER